LLRREIVKESDGLLGQAAETIPGNTEMRCVKFDAKTGDG